MLRRVIFAGVIIIGGMVLIYFSRKESPVNRNHLEGRVDLKQEPIPAITNDSPKPLINGAPDAQEDSPSHSPKEKRGWRFSAIQNLSTSEKATAKKALNNYFGFTAESGFKVTKSQIATVEVANIPFLHKLLSKKAVYLLEMAGQKVVFSGKRNSLTNVKIKYGRAIILKSTGQLIMVELTTGVKAEFPGEMDINKAEDRYGWTNEKLDGFPDKPPVFSLQGIINNAIDVSPAQIWNAKKIVALYVLYSQKGATTKVPRWLLYFRGFPPYPAKGVSNSTDAERSHLRFVFDTNGKFLSADNQP